MQNFRKKEHLSKTSMGNAKWWPQRQYFMTMYYETLSLYMKNEPKKDTFPTFTKIYTMKFCTVIGSLYFCMYWDNISYIHCFAILSHEEVVMNIYHVGYLYCIELIINFQLLFSSVPQNRYRKNICLSSINAISTFNFEHK